MFWLYFLKLATCPFKDPAIELRSVTSRYHGSKISGAQATTTATATRTSKKKKQAKQQLCMCITLICTFLSRRCRKWDMKLTNFTRPLYGVGEHNTTRTFPFLFKKRIIDPNDPQLRWILWNISKTWYFRYMILGVSLLRIRKEWIQPAVTWNNFSSLRPFLHSRNGVNDRFYPFYRDGKIAIQTGPALL